MTIPKRKLIEVALPLEAINRESAREKAIRSGHPSTFHLWWARRPLAACRAVIFASIVDDPSANPDLFPTPKSQEEERRRLFGIIEELVRWDNSANGTVLESARAEIRGAIGGRGITVLDPFSGGGSIPLEAQRLGLEVRASDLNPVAVLITKGLTEIPWRFGGVAPVHPGARHGMGTSGSWLGATGLAEDVRRYAADVRRDADGMVGRMYPAVTVPREYGAGEATVIAWLWARTVRCPNPPCGASMPLVNSWVVSSKAGHRTWIEPLVDRQARTITYRPRPGKGEPEASVGRNGARCVVCDAAVPLNHVRDEGRAGRMGATLLAVVADGPRGRLYLPPDAEQVDAARVGLPANTPETDLPKAALGFRVQGYGITKHRQLFTPRQLTTLDCFSQLISGIATRVEEDARLAGMSDDAAGLEVGGSGAAAYGQAIQAYLALTLGRLANRSSSQSFWNAGREEVEQVFARNALPMIWAYAEANPFSTSSGNYMGQVKYLANALAAVPASAPATVTQADARSDLSAGLVLVSTDPPYYDNVPYADLSDFFYVWLRQAAKNVYPALFSTVLTPKSAGSSMSGRAESGWPMAAPTPRTAASPASIARSVTANGGSVESVMSHLQSSNPGALRGPVSTRT